MCNYGCYGSSKTLLCTYAWEIFFACADVPKRSAGTEDWVPFGTAIKKIAREKEDPLTSYFLHTAVMTNPHNLLIYFCHLHLVAILQYFPEIS